jgi:hypothetical protein
MRKFLPHIIAICTLLFTVAGCKKDDDVKKDAESKLVQTAVAGVNGPTTGAVNQELTFSLVWQNLDGTAKFDHLQDSSSDNTRLIRLYALTNVVDTSIVVNKELNTVSYVFKAPNPGTYYLKFFKQDNADKTAIIDTILIK